MDPQDIVSLLASGGGGAAILALVTGIIKWLSGSADREKARNTDLLSQRRDAIVDRDEAIDARDAADARRRIISEYASQLRRLLMEAGIEPPPWPSETSSEG